RSAKDIRRLFRPISLGATQGSLCNRRRRDHKRAPKRFKTFGLRSAGNSKLSERAGELAQNTRASRRTVALLRGEDILSDLSRCCESLSRLESSNGLLYQRCPSRAWRD